MNDRSKTIKLFTQIGVTLIVLITCFIIIFGDYPEAHVKWAFGIVGVIIGYWLK